MSFVIAFLFPYCPLITIIYNTLNWPFVVEKRLKYGMILKLSNSCLNVPFHLKFSGISRYFLFDLHILLIVFKQLYVLYSSNIVFNFKTKFQSSHAKRGMQFILIKIVRGPWNTKVFALGILTGYWKAISVEKDFNLLFPVHRNLVIKLKSRCAVLSYRDLSDWVSIAKVKLL